MILTDSLPANLSNIVVTPTAPTTCSALVGNVLTCSVPAGLAQGAAAQVKVSAVVTLNGSFVNSVLPSGGNGAACLLPADCQTSTTVQKALVDVTTTLNGFPSVTNAGDTISGTVTYTNQGPGTAEGVSYTLKLPAGIGNVSVTGLTGVYNAGTGFVALSGLPVSLAPGQSISFRLSYTQPGTNASTVTSTIATTSVEVANDLPNTATVAVPGPNISVTKTANKTTANAGEDITWTITARNTGSIANQGVVTLADILPPNLMITSVTAPGVTCPPLASWVASSSQSCTIAAGQLAANNGVRTVTIIGHSWQAGSVLNLVRPAGVDNPACASGAVCQTATTITKPQVVMTKTVDKNSVNLGGTLSWTVTANNTGNGATHAPMLLIDTLPANLSGLVVAPVAPTTCTAPAGNELICTVPAGLAPGAAASFTVTARPIIAGTYVNSLVSSGADEPQCRQASDCQTTSTVTSPKVAVSKTVDKATVNIGGSLNWTLTVSNSGSGATTAPVTLVDTLPANLTALVVTPVAPATCAPVAGNILTCTVPAGLAANATASVNVTAQPTIAGTFANSVVPSGPDNPVCTTPGDCQTSSNVTSPSVTVKKTADKANANVGDTISWTLTASNGGTGPTTGIVSLLDTLPAGLTNIQVAPQAPATCAAIAGATLTCSVPAGLAPGASAKVVVKATATLAGAAVNSVLPSGPDNPICAQAGDCGTTTNVVRLLVDVTTTLNNFPPNTQPGDLISGVVSYANVGPGAADGVTYSLKLTAGLSGVTVTGASGTYNSGTGVLTLAGLPTSLASGQSTSFNISYTQPANNLSLVTSAIATTSQEVANDLPNTASVSVPGPIIRVTKLADKQVANVGDTVTWTITAVNTGSLANLGQVTLTDILPANVAVTAVTPGAGVSCPPLAS